MRNICFHHHTINRRSKEARNGHKGFIVWFTGLSGSGKSTLANKLEEALFDKHCQTIILDGDNIRHGLNIDLGFSPEDRTENIRRIGEVAKLLAGNGSIVIASFISPFRKGRNSIRSKMKKGDFIEVFLNCPVKECIKRDPKGLYRRTRSGKIKDLTGISSPYEKPLHPEIELDTAKLSADRCAQIMVGYLRKKGYIRKWPWKKTSTIF
jgi:adenylylsulfate kinase